MGDKPVERLRADRVEAALVEVLGTLTPAERLAFVLREVFALPVEEIGIVVGASPLVAGRLVARGRKVRAAAEGVVAGWRDDGWYRVASSWRYARSYDHGSAACGSAYRGRLRRRGRLVIKRLRGWDWCG